MDGNRRRLFVGLVVGVLLLVSGVAPHPVFGSPYETSEPAPYLHQAVSEDESQYDRLVDIYELEPESATPLEELSPTGQAVVEQTLESESSNEWRRYELPVCRSTVVVCDSVREPPTEFHYGEVEDGEEAFKLIEIDGERYLFQTGVQPDAGTTNGFGEAPTSTFIWLFGLLPFGVVVLASQAIAQKTGDRRVPSVLTAVGAGLIVAGLTVPYLVVGGVASYAALASPLFVGVVAVGLGGIAALVWQTVQYAQTEL